MRLKLKFEGYGSGQTSLSGSKLVKYDLSNGLSFLPYSKSLNYSTLIWLFSIVKYLVNTRHRFDIHTTSITTSITLKRRRTDVKTRSCAYWEAISIWFFKEGHYYNYLLSTLELFVLFLDERWSLDKLNNSRLSEIQTLR